MQHSSQETKEEYANKHEKEITTKMANIWERRIGTDMVHTSPTTVVTPSTEAKEKVNPWDVKLTKAGSESAASRLTKKKTVDGKKRSDSKKGSDSKKKEEFETGQLMKRKTVATVEDQKKKAMESDESRLKRKSTLDIVEDFENMKKAEDAAKLKAGLKGVEKLSESQNEMKSISDGAENGKSSVSESEKKELYDLIAKLASRLSEAEDTLKDIKGKLDAI